MKTERVLEITVEDTAQLFEHIKWKFYENDPDQGLVTVEVPRGYSESYIVELPYQNEAQYNTIKEKLDLAGFIKQTIRTRSTY